ncbi:MAG: ABC transporter permease [Candidatus Helarchaeota archaeon]
MRKILSRPRPIKWSLFVITMFLIFCLVIQSSPLFKKQPTQGTPATQAEFQAKVIYDSLIPVVITNQIISDNIFIMDYANVTLINSTVMGNVYVFNSGILNLRQSSNVTSNIVMSDFSEVIIENSSVGNLIECRDSSSLEIVRSASLTTNLYKFDAANATITNSSIQAIYDFFGTAGEILVLNSQIDTISLSGISSSRTYINNSSIQNIDDSTVPFTYVTGPISYELMLMNLSFVSSQHQINLTWDGWDSPIIDGYLNISFQILLDGAFYSEVNGSCYSTQFAGQILVNLTTAGIHNISVISFDGRGNNSTISFIFEIIEYPPFPWTIFLLTIGILLGVMAITIGYVRFREKRGYLSSIGVIFKRELLENKIKVILFISVGIVPGLILFFIFLPLPQTITISIDTIRRLVSMIFTLVLYYLGLAFSIVFAAGAVVNERKSGALSWFLSKPVRRWEFLWGKIFVYLLIIVLMMTVMAVSFVLGCISFIDPLYRPDLISMGGYVFIIGLLSIIPLTAIVVLCSSVFKKPGLAIFIPIMILIVIPPLVSFLPIITRNNFPLLFSFTYYSENLGSYWIYNGGGLFGSIGSSYGTLLGIDITPINLTPIQSILILSVITAICLVLSTYILEKKDIT